MNRKVILGFFAFFLVVAPAISTASPATLQNSISQEPSTGTISQSGGGRAALNMTTLVGLTGDSYIDGLNLLSASTLSVRRSGNQEVDSLVSPDFSGTSYKSAIDQWDNVLGGHPHEVALIGDVDESAYSADIDQASMVKRFDDTDPYSLSGELGSYFFPQSDTVVVSYADSSPSVFDSVSTLYSLYDSLPAPTQTSYYLSTSSGNYWERTLDIPRSGGGIYAWVSGSSSVLNYQLAQLGCYKNGRSYGLDYPWYGNNVMTYPYFEGYGDVWHFNFIDMYPYDRTASFTLNVRTLPRNTYSFDIPEGELSVIDFDLSVPYISPSVGLYVLDPNGQIVLDANRYALISSQMPSTELHARLSYPGPGTYRAYVTSSDSSGAQYHLSITKRVVSANLLNTGISASNGLSIASLLNSPLLFSDGSSLNPTVLSALSTISPDQIIVVDSGADFSNEVIGALSSYATVTHLDSPSDIWTYQAATNGAPIDHTDVTLFDPLDNFFSAAGMSAASRAGIAVPLCYGGSDYMTKAQVAEQMAYHGDYQYPFSGGYHFYNYWRSNAYMSYLYPSFSSMYAVYSEFQQWLTETTGVVTPGVIVDVAPFRSAGSTLPPSFDRALAGMSQIGRYPSDNPISTYAQIMQAHLRPILAPSQTYDTPALDSHIAYAAGASVPDNSQTLHTVDTPSSIASVLSAANIGYIQESGSDISNTLETPKVWWGLSSHGGIGADLYSDDGIVALFSLTSSCGYESGGSAAQPDHDGDGLVNPEESLLTVWNVSDVIGNSNLNGLIAYWDTCLLGSSYGPANALEHGADAVVACWLDSLFGPSDLLEEKFVQGVIQNRESVSQALTDAFQVNSHIYPENIEGLNYYISGSQLRIVAATSNQFVVYGDPTARFVDYQQATTPVVTRIRCSSSVPLKLTLGASNVFTMGLCDCFGHQLPASSLAIALLDENGSQIYNQTLATDGFSCVCTINLQETLPEETSRLVVSIPGTNISFEVFVQLRLPKIYVSDISVLETKQVGTWQIHLEVTNEEQWSFPATIIILLDGQPPQTASATLEPGTTSFAFQFEVVDLSLFNPANVSVSTSIQLGPDAVPLDALSKSYSVTGDWQLPVLYLVLPGLAVALGVAVGEKRKHRVRYNEIAMAEASEHETEDDHSQAFSIYMKNSMYNSATRLTHQDGYPDAMVNQLVASPPSREILNSLAHSFDSEGDFERSYILYRALNNEGSAYRVGVLASLQSGRFDEAVQRFGDTVGGVCQQDASDLLVSLIQRGRIEDAKKLVTALPDLSYGLFQSARGKEQAVELKKIADMVEDTGIRLNLLLKLGHLDIVAMEIAQAKTLKNMIAQIESVHGDEQGQVISGVVVALLQASKTQKISSLFNTLALDDSAMSTAISPITEKYFEDPTDSKIESFLRKYLEKAGPKTKEHIEAILAVVAALDASETDQVRTGRSRLDSLLAFVSKSTDERTAHMVADQILKCAPDLKDTSPSNITQIATFSGTLRGYSYQSTQVGAKMIGECLAPTEKVLSGYISHRTMNYILEVPFGPDNEMMLRTAAVLLSTMVANMTPVQDPMVALKTLNALWRAQSFAQINEVVTRHINGPALTQLESRLRADPRFRHLFGSSYGPSRTYDGRNTTYVLRDIAMKTWRNQCNQVWSIGVWSGMVSLIPKALELDMPREEKIVLFSEYLRSRYQTPSGIVNQDMKKIFLEACSRSKLSAKDCRAVLDESSLPLHLKGELESELSRQDVGG